MPTQAVAASNAFTPRVYQAVRCFHIFVSNLGNRQTVESSISEYQALSVGGAKSVQPPVGVKGETWTWDSSYQGASDSVDGQWKPNDATTLPVGDVIIYPPDGSSPICLNKKLTGVVLDPATGIVTTQVPASAVGLGVVIGFSPTIAATLLKVPPEAVPLVSASAVKSAAPKVG